MLLTHCTELAEQFNRTALRNKYEIEAIAVFGSYMSRNQGWPSSSSRSPAAIAGPGRRT